MLSRYQELLRENGLKITPKREAILDIFINEGKYATPESIWLDLRTIFKQIGLPTVYRNLEQLRQVGILTRIEGSENRYYYGLCRAENPHGHHHHIVCTSCRQVQEVHHCLFGSISQEIEEETGFHLTEHSVYLKGLCPDCRS